MVTIEDSIKLQIKDYLKRKVDVTIYHNSELGDWEYSISVNENPEFWLDSFKTNEKAINYCQKHNLRYTERKM